MEVRSADPGDRRWVAARCRAWFGSEEVAVLGRVHRPEHLRALVAWEGRQRVGVLAYREHEGEAEVVVLGAEPPGRGVGTALLGAMQALAGERGWGRLWTLTTNDNLPALGFFQRRGWDLAALHRDAVGRDRRLKPALPEVGHAGIALRHLLELEWRPAPPEAAGQ